MKHIFSKTSKSSFLVTPDVRTSCILVLFVSKMMTERNITIASIFPDHFCDKSFKIIFILHVNTFSSRFLFKLFRYLVHLGDLLCLYNSCESTTSPLLGIRENPSFSRMCVLWYVRIFEFLFIL